MGIKDNRKRADAISTSPEKTVRIAVDAMGGDDAPRVIVMGVARAVRANAQVSPVLVGDEARLKPLVAKHPELAQVEILHTDQVVAADEKPSVALRTGKESSMAMAIDLVGEGRADAVVSAGNTGALMIMAMMKLRPMEGVVRPALAAIFPTADKPTCVLDLGANIDCDEEHLAQFAIMGDAFVRIITRNPSPSIGLLNVGSEEQKGHAELQKAAAILSDDDVALNYMGFVEGDDIVAGKVDVIVTDGFAGNIALKTAEGTAKFITDRMRQGFRSSLMARLGGLLAYGSLKQMRRDLDPQRHDGAPLLGLNGVVIKSHGSTGEKGFANAVNVGSSMVAGGYMGALKHSIERSVAAIERVREAENGEGS